MIKYKRRKNQRFFDYNLFLKDRKGSEKYLSVYWFAILIIVATGISIMVSTFYDSPYDVRELEAELLVNKVVSCISEQGMVNPDLAIGDFNIQNTCETIKECQKIIGTKIVETVSEIKNDLGIQDIDQSVRDEGVAENFECLVLQIAFQESSLQHCKSHQQNNDPLYCDGNRNEVKKAEGDEVSYGVMQINIGPKAHQGKVNPENFEESIVFGVGDVLVQEYNTNKEGRVFQPIDMYYSGWETGIRGYNGWGFGGDNQYVENVIGNKDEIKSLFPEFCSEGTTVSFSNNILDECNLNFSSGTERGQYYLEINFLDFNSNDSISIISEGNENLKSDCNIQDNKEFELLSKCVEKSFYSIDEENNQYLIKILSVVRKTEENVG